MKPSYFKKVQFSVIALGFIFLTYSSYSMAESSPQEFILLAQNHFFEPTGWGETLLSLFQKKNQCSIQRSTFHHELSLITRLKKASQPSEKRAWVIMSIDSLNLDTVRPYLMQKPLLSDQEIHETFPNDLAQAVLNSPPLSQIPYSYGIFAFMSQPSLIKRWHLKTPTQLKDLQEPQWKRHILLQDPRTSLTGLAFLLYTKAILGSTTWKFWYTLQSQWLTLTASWESAYRLFMKQEAALVWSYLSSQAYHEDNSSPTGPYQALIFEDGNLLHFQSAALVQNLSAHPSSLTCAHQWLQFILSPEAQALIAPKTWMMPAKKNTPLPASYQHLPHPKKIIQIPSTVRKEILNLWRKALVNPS